ncbi:hypothetical protein TNCV_3929811 [Trichonephila clavipes]|nr:hypothetical protein TNCV_3929811 [Trichonephila clavipes]
MFSPRQIGIKIPILYFELLYLDLLRVYALTHPFKKSRREVKKNRQRVSDVTRRYEFEKLLYQIRRESIAFDLQRSHGCDEIIDLATSSSKQTLREKCSVKAEGFNYFVLLSSSIIGGIIGLKEAGWANQRLSRHWVEAMRLLEDAGKKWLENSTFQCHDGSS